MALSLPPIDRRTASEIAAQLRSLLVIYYPASFRNPNAVTGVNAALVQVMARFAEIIIQRLNQVPEKNFLAFLDLLGATQLPPQAARVPLTFTLATGTTGDAVVSAGTQVAVSETTLFETERDLIVTSIQLDSVLVREGDRYADRTATLLSDNLTSIAAFQGERPIDHVFYIGHSQLLSFPEIQNLQIQFHAVQLLGDNATVQWQIWNGTEWATIAPINPEVLNQVGNQQLNFATVPTVPISLVNGIANRWLRCRLLTPITGTIQLSSLQNLNLQATLNLTGLLLEAAFTNQLPIDLTKELFPFGEKPKFGDVFYLAHLEAFSLAGANITLNITVINPGGNTLPPTADPRLIWECWNGQIWVQLGTTSKDGAIAPVTNNFADTTNGLTSTGTVKFTLPTGVKSTTVNGIENAWLRVRIVSGNYGVEALYELVPTPSPPPPQPTYRLVPATFAPPVIQSIRVDYQLTRSLAPEAIITENDFVYSENLAVAATQPFTPFRSTTDTQPSLYLGFSLPPGRQEFPNRPISIYIKVPEISNSEALRLAWEYSNGETWQTLVVRDETAGFSRSGLVEVLVPADFTPSTEFGRERYWLRVRLLSSTELTAPHLQRLLLNTTMAIQAQTLHNEILGSSNSTEFQTFRATRTPILDGQQLDVQESDGWTHWQEVTDFYGSTPRDRHYLLNHLTGEIRFGDGQQGMIPPTGTGNIRLTRYQTGGGAAGNRNPGAIAQLKTTVPFIKAVTNFEAATGGTDAESLESLRDRIPRQLRHRDRAVTVEDYQDLAMQASPEVARAKCVPLHNLVVNPVITSQTSITPGVLSVIVVPNSDAPNPSPSLELINRVQSYLERRRLPNADLVVVGPEYVRVDVTTEVSLVSLDSASGVAASVRQTLDRFLHPLTGGLDGNGWDFGREPYKSDLYALLEAIPGVDYIRSLSISPIPDSSQFLVYSGNHTINLTI
ncbi:hypothetical protein WA1_00260 [Scytonema hofmannii PCC 7110]|uniref:Uncharacterized protein n=1 Tax=Scytonema hofmannii PCC 7110 TaxID=128403 RepID=A0A139XGA2_9CYAN|nr:putative baseplate assembly protein [Scytonema hofmannii]KYC43642.1 hypothetical protein WA1_00260 [Scytonema hofmannii PCC 7110]